MGICSGLCDRLKRENKASGDTSLLRFKNYKYCKACRICFYEIYDWFCPCCDRRLNYNFKQYNAPEET